MARTEKLRRRVARLIKREYADLQAFMASQPKRHPVRDPLAADDVRNLCAALSDEELDRLVAGEPLA
jgi:hypothetical protein